MKAPVTDLCCSDTAATTRVTPRSWWINEDLEFGPVVCIRIIMTRCFVYKQLAEEEILTRFKRSKDETKAFPPGRDQGHK